MNDKQFRQELKRWLEDTWQTIGPETTRMLTENTELVQTFWQNHVDECVALAKDAAFLPDLLLFLNPPHRLASPAKMPADHGGLTIHRRDDLVVWLKEKYSRKFKQVHAAFVDQEVTGLHTFDFIETTIGGTKFSFRKDRIPYHYKKNFGRTKGFKPLT